MSAADVVARLHRVRQTGAGRWIASCPAHEDRRPSLNVRELEDGRTLIHCFSGCEVDSIVSAIGLRVADLFPPRPATYAPHPQRGFNPMDVLYCLAHESRVLLIAARDLAEGQTLAPDETERLALAACRIAAGLDVAHGY